MKKVTVSNFKGQEFSGDWNEKTYSSRINGCPELHRIYINSEQIHITEEELSNITENLESIKSEQKKQQSLNAKMRAKELFNQMTDEDSYELAESIIYKFLQQVQETDARASNNAHQALCKIREKVMNE